MESMKMDTGPEQKGLLSINPRDFVKTNIKPVTIVLSVIGK